MEKKGRVKIKTEKRQIDAEKTAKVFRHLIDANINKVRNKDGHAECVNVGDLNVDNAAEMAGVEALLGVPAMRTHASPGVLRDVVKSLCCKRLTLLVDGMNPSTGEILRATQTMPNMGITQISRVKYEQWHIPDFAMAIVVGSVVRVRAVMVPRWRMWRYLINTALREIRMMHEDVRRGPFEDAKRLRMPPFVFEVGRAILEIGNPELIAHLGSEITNAIMGLSISPSVYAMRAFGLPPKIMEMSSESNVKAPFGYSSDWLPYAHTFSVFFFMCRFLTYAGVCALLPAAMDKIFTRRCAWAHGTLVPPPEGPHNPFLYRSDEMQVLDPWEQELPGPLVEQSGPRCDMRGVPAGEVVDLTVHHMSFLFSCCLGDSKELQRMLVWDSWIRGYEAARLLHSISESQAGHRSTPMNAVPCKMTSPSDDTNIDVRYEKYQAALADALADANLAWSDRRTLEQMRSELEHNLTLPNCARMTLHEIDAQPGIVRDSLRHAESLVACTSEFPVFENVFSFLCTAGHSGKTHVLARSGAMAVARAALTVDYVNMVAGAGRIPRLCINYADPADMVAAAVEGPRGAWNPPTGIPDANGVDFERGAAKLQRVGAVTALAALCPHSYSRAKGASPLLHTGSFDMLARLYALMPLVVLQGAGVDLPEIKCAPSSSLAASVPQNLTRRACAELKEEFGAHHTKSAREVMSYMPALWACIAALKTAVEMQGDDSLNLSIDVPHARELLEMTADSPLQTEDAQLGEMFIHLHRGTTNLIATFERSVTGERYVQLAGPHRAAMERLMTSEDVPLAVQVLVWRTVRLERIRMEHIRLEARNMHVHDEASLNMRNNFVKVIRSGLAPDGSPFNSVSAAFHSVALSAASARRQTVWTPSVFYRILSRCLVSLRMHCCLKNECAGWVVHCETQPVPLDILAHVSPLGETLRLGRTFFAVFHGHASPDVVPAILSDVYDPCILNTALAFRPVVEKFLMDTAKLRLQGTRHFLTTHRHSMRNNPTEKMAAWHDYENGHILLLPRKPKMFDAQRPRRKKFPELTWEENAERGFPEETAPFLPLDPVYARTADIEPDPVGGSRPRATSENNKESPPEAPPSPPEDAEDGSDDEPSSFGAIGARLEARLEEERRHARTERARVQREQAAARPRARRVKKRSHAELDAELAELDRTRPEFERQLREEEERKRARASRSMLEILMEDPELRAQEEERKKRMLLMLGERMMAERAKKMMAEKSAAERGGDPEEKEKEEEEK